MTHEDWQLKNLTAAISWYYLISQGDSLINLEYACRTAPSNITHAANTNSTIVGVEDASGD
jgi:hypothetical protein